MLSQGGIGSPQGRQKPRVELAEHFDVHPNQISEWEQQLQEFAADVFGGPPKNNTITPCSRGYEALKRGATEINAQALCLGNLWHDRARGMFQNCRP